MKRIFIIGCGFSGLACARRLSRSKEGLEVSVIDKRKNFNFLPLLPDCIGRNIKAGSVTFPISLLSKRYGFNFINSVVERIDLDRNIIYGQGREFNYDYLVIASGSETNFYGNDSFEKFAYKLDDADDVFKISRAIEDDSISSFVISGGGYTGIEIATSLRQNTKTKNKRLVIVERTSSILGALPAWMKKYISANLRQLGIEVFLDSTIERIENKKIFLAGGEMFEGALLIWASGVKTAGFIQNLNIEKNSQGRINTDQYLRIRDNCFVIGDAASFLYRDKPLRMAVQFSVCEGDLAASNIVGVIRGRPLKKLRPLDLGYIIPMANNRSCGNVFGINIRGYLATFFHYIMCVYRSVTLKNKLGLIMNLLNKPKSIL